MRSICCDAVRFRLSLAWVIKLQMYTRTALEEARASEMPLTSRLVMILVKSEPGPTVIRSASSIASRVSGSGSASAGSSIEFNDALPAGGDVGLPVYQGTVVHACGEGDVGIGDRVDMAAGGEHLRESLMAWAKSPVISSSAATKRLPKLWPSRPSPAVKRWRKSREIRCSSSERATMQLRRSPGGSMLKPRRSRPLEPRHRSRSPRQPDPR